MFSKFMWVAGIGLVFGCAIKAVKEIKEEQKIMNTNNKKIGQEPVSFKDAAIRKVKKIRLKFVDFVIDHMQEVQAITMVLGIAVPVVETMFMVKQANQLDNIERIVQENRRAIHDNKVYIAMTGFDTTAIVEKVGANDLPDERLRLIYNKTRALYDLDK